MTPVDRLRRAAQRLANADREAKEADARADAAFEAYDKSRGGWFSTTACRDREAANRRLRSEGIISGPALAAAVLALLPLYEDLAGYTGPIDGAVEAAAAMLPDAE